MLGETGARATPDARLPRPRLLSPRLLSPRLRRLRLRRLRLVSPRLLRRRPRAGRWFVGAALRPFVATAVVALVFLSLLGVEVRDSSRRAAINTARELTVAQTRSFVEPSLTEAVVRGDPQSLAHFDAVVHDHLLGGRVARVKLWTPAGRIVYSDEPRLVGRVFPLEEVDQAVLRTGQAHADVSQLSADENVLERPTARQLLQVYTRVRTQSGLNLLFETYLRLDAQLAGGPSFAWSGALALLLGLAVLEVVRMPLTWRLARRVARGHQERDTLQRRAAQASDVERRRIARNLHDGVVQSLAGVSYSLAAVAERLRPVAEPELVEQVRAATRTTREGVAELRTLINDIHPPALDRHGLAAALADLLPALQLTGIAATLDAGSEPPASAETAAAVHRAAQEALRNVVSHAHATSVAVELLVTGRSVRLRVTDDGAGFDTRRPPAGDRPHLGLTLLNGLAEGLGGRLHVVSEKGQGTALTFEVPQ